jgi:hypothetical protein
MNKCIGETLYVFIGDIVSILSCSDYPDCTRVHILPFKDTFEGLSGDPFNKFLKPYFASTHLVVAVAVVAVAVVAVAVVAVVFIAVTDRPSGIDPPLWHFR